MAEQSQSREAKLAPVIAKAWQDANFKKQLMANPKGVLEKEFGIKFPANLQIEVREESASKLYLVLPPKPSSGELSEDQLEGVAGGACIPIAGVAVGCASAGAAFGGAAAGGRRW